MRVDLLKTALQEMKQDFENSISTATYNGNRYTHGQQAKEALIRSQSLIFRIHEVVKQGLNESLGSLGMKFTIHPPLDRTSPELTVSGFVKRKQQDVSVLFDYAKPQPSKITEGALAESIDPLGKDCSEKALIVGVRSQLSSVAKNFDTLMERTFAETLNLRLRLPELVMGEVYLLAIPEYSPEAMKQNTVHWRGSTMVEKFINTFTAISGRHPIDTEEDLYKYERTALLLVDFRPEQPKLFLTTEELRHAGFISADYAGSFEPLSPLNFASDLVQIYQQRHASFLTAHL